jgi:uncharacterized protein YciI
MGGSNIFAVFRNRGVGWNDSAPLEGQTEWQAHADFMDGLAAEGFAVLVGPLEGTRDALLILRASSAEEVHARLDGDPWTRNGLLRTTLVAPWTLRIGSLE